MKKTVPFSKEIPFKTRIAEITDIEVKHDLTVSDESEISGNFLVSGTYKITDASQIEEEFKYELPFIIEVDSKYVLDNVNIKISDFYFEIINEDILKVNIEVELDNIEEKEEELIIERCYDKIDFDEDIDNINLEINDDFLEQIDNEIEKESLNENMKIEPIDINDNVPSKKMAISDMFTSINSKEDNFRTYHVYIVRENDTLESIILKYKTSRESLGEYNNLDDIKIGTKLIIPCSNE